MVSASIETVVKMMESLPEASQNQVVEYLRNYIEGLNDELQWDSLFERTKNKLVEAAKRAKKEIADGHAKPMNYNNL